MRSSANVGRLRRGVSAPSLFAGLGGAWLAFSMAAAGAPTLGPVAGTIPSTPPGPLIDPGSWVNVTNTTGPLGVTGGTMVWDANDGYFVLVTQANATGNSSTYLLANERWVLLHGTATPIEYDRPILAYDASDGYVLLFTSRGTCGSFCNDTWTFHAGQWADISGSVKGAPPPTSGASAAFDPAIGAVLMFSGTPQSSALCEYTSSCNTTWTYHRGVWQRLDLSRSPPQRSYAAMTYDPQEKAVVLFSGDSGLNDTWEFQGGEWTLLHLRAGPSPRAGASFAFSDFSQEALLFGGGPGAGNFTLPSQTWVLRSGNWTEVAANPAPPNRSYAVAGYDPILQHIVLAGGSQMYQLPIGFGAARPRSDTWTWSAPPAISVNFSYQPPSTCGQPVNVTFTPILTGGVPPYSYLWEFGDASPPSTLQAPTHEFFASGFGSTITLTASDSAGDSSSTSHRLMIFFPPCAHLVPVVLWSPAGWVVLGVVVAAVTIPIAIYLGLRPREGRALRPR